MGKDDRNLVGYLRKKSEIEKANVSRRTAPSEELMRKSITSCVTGSVRWESRKTRTVLSTS